MEEDKLTKYYQPSNISLKLRAVKTRFAQVNNMSAFARLIRFR